MAKDIDDLLRDVFGNGKGRAISTQKAETYLQQSRRLNRGLDALDKQQEDLNRRLQNQLDELKKMSGELDFERIQKEVEKDFGIAGKQTVPARQETAAQEKNARPEAQRFGDLLPKLTGELIGQEVAAIYRIVEVLVDGIMLALRIHAGVDAALRAQGM